MDRLENVTVVAKELMKKLLFCTGAIVKFFGGQTYQARPLGYKRTKPLEKLLLRELCAVLEKGPPGKWFPSLRHR